MRATAELARQTLLQKPTRGIPSWMLNVMEHSHIERLAGAAPGSYRKDPEPVYLAMQRAIGVGLLDQFIPDNPLSMGDQGYEGRSRGATTGAEQIWVDGLLIDSPEAVVRHLESVAFPGLEAAEKSFDENSRVRAILDQERAIQDRLGPDILKTGYGFVSFPCFDYGRYGYENYFSAYALYPEVIERHFKLQADCAVLNNRAAARAFFEGELPLLYRLDHDMADSRGTLVDIRSLDRIWFPHFARALAPMLKTDVKMIWHCDGNLMAMAPRLLEVGLRGFQGFQVECGMDYPKICKMKTREGEDLVIIAGMSVTKTLPFGRPSDVARELTWLVECGPRTGLFLGASSSIAPGVPWPNMMAFVDGLKHFSEVGRGRG